MASREPLFLRLVAADNSSMTRATAFDCGWQPPPQPCTLGAVKRIARILLLALFVGPQLGELILPSEPLCEEARDCCTPNAHCDVNCVQCSCCPARITSLAPALAGELQHSLSAQTAPVAITAPLPPPPTDILHVPKSIR